MSARDIIVDGVVRSWTWAHRNVFPDWRHTCELCGLDCDSVDGFLAVVRDQAKLAPAEVRRRWLILDRWSLVSSSSDAAIWKVPAMLVLGSYGFQPHDLDRVTYQIDHITPVAEDGEPCELDNLRLLCAPCHRDVTSGFNRNRVKKGRRKARATRPKIPSRPLPKGQAFPKGRRWPSGKRRVKRGARWEPRACEKRGYPSKEQALRANRKNGHDLRAYWCHVCGRGYHVAKRDGGKTA